MRARRYERQEGSRARLPPVHGSLLQMTRVYDGPSPGIRSCWFAQGFTVSQASYLVFIFGNTSIPRVTPSSLANRRCAGPSDEPMLKLPGSPIFTPIDPPVACNSPRKAFFAANHSQTSSNSAKKSRLPSTWCHTHQYVCFRTPGKAPEVRLRSSSPTFHEKTGSHPIPTVSCDSAQSGVNPHVYGIAFPIQGKSISPFHCRCSLLLRHAPPVHWFGYRLDTRPPYFSARTRWDSLSPMYTAPVLLTKIPWGRDRRHALASPSGPSPRWPVPTTVVITPDFRSTLRMV